MTRKSPLDSVPLVEKVLQALGEADPPRPAIAAVVGRELAALRSKKITPGINDLLAASRSALDSLRASRIQPLINGTGVLVHPEHGHPPLGGEVIEALQSVAANYTNVEFDSAGGNHGDCAAFLEHNLALVCGAEAATALNNPAAALLLVLRHFTARERKEVVIARVELVRAGGSGVAEIVKAGGATMRKAGTTKRTSLDHYHKAIGGQTAVILRAHDSGVSPDAPPKSPSPNELAALAKNHRVPLVVYLFTGGVTETAGLTATGRAPAAAEALKHGGDAACFNGGVLLGGPQAGIIAGSAKLIAALRKDHFFSALRCDKFLLSALQTTVDLHLSGQGSIPLRAMLGISVDELQTRARRILAAIESLPMKITIGGGRSQIGGARPRAAVPTVTLELQPLVMSLEDFAARLRAGTPPVLGCIEGERFKLDLRTVFPRQDEALFRAILQTFAKGA